MKEFKNKPGVIVIGGHVQGLGIVRIYGENGIQSIILDKTNKNLARHSKYAKAFYQYRPTELLEKLIELGENKKYEDWLLVPTNDAHIEVICNNKEKLSTYFNISTDDWDVIKYCYNKRLTYKIADELGINYPKTWTPNSIDELNNLTEIEFPCIIKPAVMHSFYSKLKKKVLFCNSKQELFTNYNQAIKIIPSEEIIIQEIIPGSNENQYSACFLFNRNESIVSLVAQRKRQHPLDFGNATTFAETKEEPELIKAAQKLLSRINYKGICEVEFKKDERDGQFKFLEINPRSWKWHIISKKSKSPFLISLYHLMYDEKQDVKNDWEKACFKHILTDTSVVFKMLLKSKFKPSKCNNLQYAVWDSKDLKPAIFEILYLPVFIFTR